MYNIMSICCRVTYFIQIKTNLKNLSQVASRPMRHVALDHVTRAPIRVYGDARTRRSAYHVMC